MLTTVASAGPEDVDAAVLAARRAFDDPTWSRMNPHDRTVLLLRMADAIESHAAELAELDSLDNGTPYSMTSAGAPNSARVFRYYAGWPTKLSGSVNPSRSDRMSYTIRQPIGVCAGIIPWNAPLSMAVWKIAPALACGNTVIIKPAEDTPLSVLRLAELLSDCGLPDGVLNVLTGFGTSAGAAIAAHPGIDKVAFTGSTETGKAILRASTGNLKRVTLELGGKSPHIIFDDADVDTAARVAAAGFCNLSGQVCLAGTRIFVHERIYDEFAEALAREVSAFTVGDPFEDATRMGPLASLRQFERVSEYLDLGRDEGGTVRAGGPAYERPGYFVPATVFEGITNDMRLAQEEIFGPVAALIPFSSEEDVLRQANDSRYGLAAAVATNDLSRAHRLARDLQAGIVWLNTYGELDPAAPFGGYKQSGIGRELGEDSLDNFTETKTIVVRL